MAKQKVVHVQQVTVTEDMKQIDFCLPDGRVIARLSPAMCDDGPRGVYLEIKGASEVKANGRDVDGEIDSVTISLLES